MKLVLEDEMHVSSLCIRKKRLLMLFCKGFRERIAISMQPTSSEPTRKSEAVASAQYEASRASEGVVMTYRPKHLA